MPSAKTRRPFILVIDDEPLVAAVIADTLMLVGYEVETAKNGREALEKIAACSYDLILSDLRMPELDGVGLYRELERHAPRLLQRLIFLSGTTDSAEYIRFLEGTGALVLCKPFDIDTLQRLVRQFLLNEDTPRIGDVEGEEAEYLPLDHPHSEPNCSFCAVRQTPMQHRLLVCHLPPEELQLRARVTPGATGIASGTTGGRAESDVGSALRHGDAGRSENPGFSHTPRLQGSMHTEARSYTVGDFVRRVVGGLLQGKYRGKFLCSRCLITLTKDSLDKSYTLADIGLVMSDVFKAPGEITLLPASTCALCARKKPTPCLGVPLP